MYSKTYPYLDQLLGASFHQDAYDLEGTDENIMRDYRETTHEYQRLGARADIRRFLHQYHGELLPRLQELFAPDIIIGHTEEEARDWLLKIDGLLDEPA